MAASRVRDGLRRVARGAAWGLVTVLTLVLLVSLLLGFRPVREGLLEAGLRAARTRLPGSLQIAGSSWPRPGRIELQRIVWSLRADTLLAADSVDLRVRLTALLQRDLRVERLSIVASSIDVPRIAAAFPRAAQSSVPQPRSTWFLRAGALPGVPGVAIDSLELRIGGLSANATTTLQEVVLRGGVDLTRAHGPRVRIDDAAAHDVRDRWSVTVAGLQIDGERGRLAGTASATLDSSITLQVELDTAADGNLHAHARLEPRLGEDAGHVLVEITARPGRQGLRLQSLAYEARASIPGTSQLAHWPEPIRRARRLPALAETHLAATGVVHLRPQFDLALHAAVTPQDWIEALQVQLGYREGDLEVDSLRVDVPGLHARLRGRRTHGRVDARADVDIRDARWLSLVHPEGTKPESLVASLHATAQGAAASPALQLRLGAVARWSGVDVEPCSLTASYPAGVRAPGIVRLAVGARGLQLVTAARLALTSPVQAELAPIRVQTREQAGSEAPPPAASLRDAGRVQFDPASGDLRLENVRVTGALGDAALHAAVQRFAGNFGLDWEWTEPPSGIGALLGTHAAVWDSIRARWGDDTRFGIHLSGRRERDASGIRTRVEGDVHFPGPRIWAPLLHVHPRPGSFGPLQATVGAVMTEAGDDRTWGVEADLSRTAWLHGSNLRVRGHADSIEVQDLRLGLEDLTLALSATMCDSVVQAQSHIVLEDGALLRSLGAFDEADTLRVEATAAIAGSLHDPRLRVEFEAAGHYGAWETRELSGYADRRTGRWTARIRAPRGLAGPVPPLLLDSLTVSFDSEHVGPDPLPGTLRLRADGPRLDVVCGAALSRDAGWEARSDTLGLVLLGKDLRSRGPFVVGMHDGRLRFEDLWLEGSLGRVQAAGSIGRHGVDLAGDAALELDGFAFVPALPASIWPQRVELRVRSREPQSLELQGTIQNFALGSRPALRARITAHADSSRVATHVEIIDGPNTPLRGDLELPAPWRHAPAGDTAQVEADAVLIAFPMPWELLGSDAASIPASTLDAHLHVAGTATRPSVQLAVGLQIPVGDGPPARVQAAAALGADTPAFAATPEVQGLDLGRLRELRRELGGEGVVALLRLARGDKRELGAASAIPLRFAGAHRVAVDPQRPLRLQVDIPELVLADWQELLPPGTTLDGRLVGSLEVNGVVADPELRGSLALPQFGLATRDGSRASGNGTLNLQGSGRRPVVRGMLTVTNALVPIPEEPRKLLPVNGRSLLRQAAGVVPESLTAPAAAPPPASEASRRRSLPIQPDVDIEVVVPSGCWIKGRSLSVELSGKLRLRQKGAEPTVLGELEARQGTLVFLGRTFQLDRGIVRFFGDDETNPTLDVRLSSKISSTVVRILVSGTAQEPEVDLVSEPEMSQSDIMSLLVFGRPKDELDGDELQLVAQRSAAIAATWGAAELQGLSSSLGVDMLRLQPGATPSGESSVVVGKYLSERALLKYEQALDSTTGFFVALQYTLTRNLTVETQAGTWQSGAELNWSKNY